MNRKLKVSLIVLAAVIVAAAAVAGTLIFMAKDSANEYRSAATRQLNLAISGQEAGVAVELNLVWFGDNLNSDYRKVNSLQSDYAALLGDLKNYVAILNAHNALVEQYNNGLKNGDSLDGNLLKTVNKYADLIENRFPNEKDRLSTMRKLSEKITSNTDFESVGDDINAILADNDDWLSEVRNQLNDSIAAFQKKIN